MQRAYNQVSFFEIFENISNGVLKLVVFEKNIDKSSHWFI